MAIETGTEGAFPEKEHADDDVTTGTTSGTAFGTSTGGTTTATTTGDGHPPRAEE
jgi:hypothetical protein